MPVSDGHPIGRRDQAKGEGRASAQALCLGLAHDDQPCHLDPRSRAGPRGGDRTHRRDGERGPCPADPAGPGSRRVRVARLVGLLVRLRQPRPVDGGLARIQLRRAARGHRRGDSGLPSNRQAPVHHVFSRIRHGGFPGVRRLADVAPPRAAGCGHRPVESGVRPAMGGRLGRGPDPARRGIARRGRGGHPAGLGPRRHLP